jgi:hypothetical protein
MLYEDYSITKTWCICLQVASSLHCSAVINEVLPGRLRSFLENRAAAEEG